MSLQQGKIPYGKIPEGKKPDGKIPEGKKPKVYRKAILSDFITDTPSNGLDNCTAYKFEKSNEKPKNYRIQGEFGQKKFIKP
tara:strand:- start:1817 stop:2062 length:246 start_codon:yes stop_codon:yes gene_type:complete